MISDEQIEAYQRDGAVMVKGALSSWVEVMAEAVAANLAEPGPYASENAVTEGRFFDDYCNWERLPAMERVVRESPASELAARVMRSGSAQFFHDHVLVKEGGTPMATPWHQDGPYYFVEGSQTVSMWAPLDPVREASLRLIAGSHLWDKPVRPVSWADNSDFYAGEHEWIEVPDPDGGAGDHRILEWAMEPGDVVLFNFRTVHGARGNLGGARRRAVSLRWVGDDARYVQRSGRTSPPFPGHGMVAGQRLREDWFPILHSST